MTINISESISTCISYGIIGVISMIFGGICINLILDKQQKDKYNTFKTYIMFFIIGIIIHIITQYLNLDQIYCDKKCQMRLANKA